MILKAARAHAAFEGRQAITDRDILLAAELALPHRLKRGPFSESTLYDGELEERMEEIGDQYEEHADLREDATQLDEANLENSSPDSGQSEKKVRR